MMQNKMKELDLKERSSKSLLANVLDMDDDFRPSSTLPGAAGPARGGVDPPPPPPPGMNPMLGGGQPPMGPLGGATPTPGGMCANNGGSNSLGMRPVVTPGMSVLLHYFCTARGFTK